jgi:hypothetical protein
VLLALLTASFEARSSVLAGERKLERAGEREATTQAGCVGGSPGSRHGERSASRLLVLKRSNPTGTRKVRGNRKKLKEKYFRCLKPSVQEFLNLLYGLKEKLG